MLKKDVTTYGTKSLLFFILSLPAPMIWAEHYFFKYTVIIFFFATLIVSLYFGTLSVIKRQGRGVGLLSVSLVLFLLSVVVYSRVVTSRNGDRHQVIEDEQLEGYQKNEVKHLMSEPQAPYNK